MKRVRIPWASRKDIKKWLLVSLGIATTMLVGVVISGYLSTGDAGLGEYNLLLNPADRLEDLFYLLTRNVLVLGIHFGACIIGAIIGRRRFNIEDSEVLSKFNPDLPHWVSVVSLWYAWIVTLSSVVIQVSKIGVNFADLAAAANIPVWESVVLTLPHAIIELTAIFLPLGLFIVQATKGELSTLGKWSLQAAGIALLMILCAGLIEVFVSPYIFAALV